MNKNNSLSVFFFLYSIRQNSIEFLRPVFLHAICNPNVTEHTKLIWTCVLSQVGKSNKSLDLLYEVFKWNRVSNNF